MRKRYTSKQKAQIVLEILKEEKTATQIASEYGIQPNQLHRWKKQAEVCKNPSVLATILIRPYFPE